MVEGGVGLGGHGNGLGVGQGALGKEAVAADPLQNAVLLHVLHVAGVPSAGGNIGKTGGSCCGGEQAQGEQSGQEQGGEGSSGHGGSFFLSMVFAGCDSLYYILVYPAKQ